MIQFQITQLFNCNSDMDHIGSRPGIRCHFRIIRMVATLFLEYSRMYQNSKLKHPAGLKTALVVVHFLQNQKMLNPKKCVFTVAK